MAEKLKKYSTPVGEMEYPWILKPSTKFKPDGEYQVNLILEEKETEELTTLINEAIDAHFNTIFNKLTSKKDRTELAKAYPYNPEYRLEGEGEEADEVETGRIKFKFRQAAQVIAKKTGETVNLTVNVFDKFGRPLGENTSIWSGSTGTVNFSIVPYYNPATKKVGVKLQLNAVMVKTLVQGGGGSAEDYGFEVEDMEEEEQLPQGEPAGDGEDPF